MNRLSRLVLDPLFALGLSLVAGYAAAAPLPLVTEPAASEGTRQKLRDYLFDAARSGNTAMLREFVGAHYNLDTVDEKGYTALILAAYHGNAEAVELLLNAGANPCAEDAHGNTALMGAIFKGELGIARTLVKADCSPNQANHAGQTPAMYAALFGRAELLDALARKGADLSVQDAAGNSARSLAQGEIKSR